MPNTNPVPAAPALSEADTYGLEKRLRDHVVLRNGPSGNGAWQMMLDAADALSAARRRVVELESGCKQACNMAMENAKAVDEEIARATAAESVRALACPCCAATPETRDWVGHGAVICRGCGLSLNRLSNDRTKPLPLAIAAWNRRHG